MKTISEIQKKYLGKIDLIDLEILLANSIKKSREFILAHPEYTLTAFQVSRFKIQAHRRMRGEPIAYILGHKEFFGLDFAVNKHTLIPRPETELIVELVLNELKVESQKSKVAIVDVGTGSGNIITSIVKTTSGFKFQASSFKFFAIDISKDALKIARKNAKTHGVQEKIKFLHGNLLDPILKAKSHKLEADNLIILANLPYLSKEIFESAPIDVKKFEPKSALFSPKAGLAHYEKLLKQIREILVSCSMLHVSCFLEISPEQKAPITKLVKSILPKAKISFSKDLASKWRMCRLELLVS